MKKIKVKKFNFVLISTLLILCFDVWSIDDAGQIERRLDQIEKLLRTDGLLNLSSDVDKLKEDQRSLQGRIEEIEFKLQSNKSETSDVFVEKTNEVTIDESTGIEEKDEFSLESLQSKIDNEVKTDNQIEVNKVLSGEELYKKSFALLKAADYEESISGFREYLSKFPQGKFADNSMFWIGEAYWVVQDFDKAIEEYTELTKIYPKSQKSSHALLKIGYCYEKLGKKADAIKALNDLQEKFPNSTAARLGLVKLEKLKSNIN